MQILFIKKKRPAQFIKKPILFLLIAVLIFGAYFLFFSKTPIIPTQAGRQTRLVPIYYVDTKEKKVAFSFDACWGASHTPALLEILRENNIKTTFFLTGFWVEKFPEMVKKICEEGHEIGNHTYSHPHLNGLGEQEIKIELERVGNMIFELTDVQPTLFRPPFGEYSNKVIKAAEKCGYLTIQWSIDSLDWQELGKEPMVKRVTEKLHPGAIILFHNNGKYTAEALPEIIEYTKERGYTIVPISELLYKENYYIDSNTGAQIQNPPASG
ncbi:MAG TPA: polysaccharide deacetylase family protein [Firmicutes bacterium]|jgi:polysaccharide deacetylase family sporulation protein PdaB|nr:polysaccharide deacetylase family protein [Bacillota bacterium]